MADNENLLGQDDIDALLNASDTKKGSDGDAGRFPGIEPVKLRKISDEDVLAMSVRLYNKGFLKRDPDVCVIWNALGTLPMNSGVGIKVQGMEYVTLGVLRSKHLVVKQRA